VCCVGCAYTQDTVKQNIKRAVRNVLEMGLEDFIFGNPAQVGVWARRAQVALASLPRQPCVLLSLCLWGVVPCRGSALGSLSCSACACPNPVLGPCCC